MTPNCLAACSMVPPAFFGMCMNSRRRAQLPLLCCAGSKSGVRERPRLNDAAVAQSESATTSTCWRHGNILLASTLLD